MSIASAIATKQQQVASAYTACNGKGATMPATENLTNLATCISSIPTGGSSPVITSLSVTPTTSAQTITAPSGTDGYSPVNVSAVTASIDSNITASNIKKNVTILGVTGSYEGSGGGYTEIPSYVISNGVASRRSFTLTGNEFSGVTSIGVSGLYCVFYNCSGITGLVNLSSVTSIGDFGLSYGFYNCSGLTGIDLSSVTSIGNSALYYAFASCIGFTSLNLSSVTSIGDLGLSYGCRGCISLTDIYFNSLTTESFGSYKNQFNNLMVSTGSTTTHTIHFPSNMQSKISKLTGYPNFGGTGGYVVLAFDLPATS